MRKLFSSILATLALLHPLVAFAAPPSVTGLQANYANGVISVNWMASEDLTVAYYRVYWSRQSILENDGRWEDFDATLGKEPSYELKDYPQAPSLWIGVMAVTTYGEESPVFTEEVRVDLMANAVSSSSSVSSQSSTTSQSSTSSVSSASALELLSAQAVSATGVLLTFSLPIGKLSQQDAAKALTIVDASGSLLQLRKMTITDNTILATTLPQRREIRYAVSASNVLKSSVGMPLNMAMSQASFTGHPTGLTPESVSNQQQPVLVQDIANLSIRAEQQQDGTYIVTANWIPRDAIANIFAYQIRQTRDGGRTWSEQQTVPANTTSVRVGQVPAGNFGVLVKVIGNNGLISQGTYGAIELPVFDPGVPVPPVTGTVKDPPIITPKPPKVPQTGAPEVLVVLLAGVAGGFHAARKRHLALPEAK